MITITMITIITMTTMIFYARFDKNKLKEILSAADPQLNGKKNNKKSFTEKALDKLTSSRFRSVILYIYNRCIIINIMKNFKS